MASRDFIHESGPRRSRWWIFEMLGVKNVVDFGDKFSVYFPQEKQAWNLPPKTSPHFFTARKFVAWSSLWKHPRPQIWGHQDGGYPLLLCEKASDVSTYWALILLRQSEWSKGKHMCVICVTCARSSSCHTDVAYPPVPFPRIKKFPKLEMEEIGPQRFGEGSHVSPLWAHSGSTWFSTSSLWRGNVSSRMSDHPFPTSSFVKEKSLFEVARSPSKWFFQIIFEIIFVKSGNVVKFMQGPHVATKRPYWRHPIQVIVSTSWERRTGIRAFGAVVHETLQSLVKSHSRTSRDGRVRIGNHPVYCPLNHCFPWKGTWQIPQTRIAIISLCLALMKGNADPTLYWYLVLCCTSAPMCIEMIAASRESGPKNHAS